MNTIILAVGIVAGLGLLCGLVLAVASIVMAVPADEKTEALRALLPGANCGACGYSGCDSYAAAMAAGEAEVGLCSPGGASVAADCGRLLGVDARLQAKVCLVHCGGCEDVTARKLIYQGLPSCKAANQFFGGDWQCRYGCLGYGDCSAACSFGAIRIQKGLCVVDPQRCRGCGLCVDICPKGLLSLTPAAVRGVVRCSSRDKGAAVRAACRVGCIGCQKCVKICPESAVSVDQFLARIDPEKCRGCGLCADACPAGCIEMLPASGMPPEAEQKVSPESQLV